MGGTEAVEEVPAAWVGPAAGAGDACHHVGMKALAWPLRQHITTTAASANPAPLLHLFPVLVMISLSLSLVRRRPQFEHLRARSLPSATLPRALVASAVMPKGVWFGGRNFHGNFVEISPQRWRPPRGFFFLWITEPASRPGAHPPASVRRCRRRRRRASEVALGERSRPPVRVRVDPTPPPSPRPTAFSSCLRVAWERFEVACVVSWNSWLELCELVVVVVE